MITRAVLLVLVIVAVAAPARPTAPVLLVVVHPDRKAHIDMPDLARIYLRQRRFWDDGTPIVALNRESGSRTRELFSARVLGHPSGYFVAYWDQQYFHGIFPPASLASAAAVRRYVAFDRNALGYLAPDEIDASVRVILRID